MNEYLHSVGVTVTPVSPESPANVRVDVPLPQGWENLGALDPAYLIADKPSGADQGRTPSAVVYLIKLGGPLDARKVISEHGFADAQNTQNFQKIASSLDDFQGYPSAAIEGTYENQGAGARLEPGRDRARRAAALPGAVHRDNHRGPVRGAVPGCRRAHRRPEDHEALKPLSLSTVMAPTVRVSSRE